MFNKLYSYEPSLPGPTFATYHPRLYIFILEVYQTGDLRSGAESDLSWTFLSLQDRAELILSDAFLDKSIIS